MKPSILPELLDKLRHNHQFKRKFKVILSLSLVGILMVGALVIWAGITTVQYVASVGTNSKLQEQVQNAKNELQKFPAVTKIDCWNQVQNLLKVETWLKNPLADTFNNLKIACLTTTSTVCKGAECNSPKSSNRAEQ